MTQTTWEIMIKKNKKVFAVKNPFRFFPIKAKHILIFLSFFHCRKLVLTGMLDIRFACRKYPFLQHLYCISYHKLCGGSIIFGNCFKKFHFPVCHGEAPRSGGLLQRLFPCTQFSLISSVGEVLRTMKKGITSDTASMAATSPRVMVMLFTPRFCSNILA